MDEREQFEAFEAWAKDHLGQGYPLTWDESDYINNATAWAFRAFKAGRASLKTQPLKLVDYRGPSFCHSTEPDAEGATPDIHDGREQP